MVTEALIKRLKELRASLANLVSADANAQMSNERYMSDGTHAKMSADIGGTKAQLQKLYFDHPYIMQPSHERQLNIVSEDGGQSFTIRAIDISRPGVIKSVQFSLDRHSLGDFIDYLGGRQVTLQGQHIDSIAAVDHLKEHVAALEAENKRLTNELRKETLRSVDFEEKYNLLDTDMKARFADAE